MKLRKTVKVGATVQYVQDYLSGGVEYRQTGTGVKRVESVFHAEGRYYNTNVDASNTISWRREYNIKDHLGNTRLVFTDRNANGVVDITGTASTSDVLQENHYYAFGLPFEGAWLQNDAAARDNKYQYNGKEFNDDFGLNWNDYGARWYDASVGRWNAVDSKSEKYFSLTPFSYVGNSPLIFIDPNGRDINVSKLSESGLKALVNVLQTKEGWNLIASYAHKGDKLSFKIGNKELNYTFKTEGKRAKDELVLMSEDNLYSDGTTSTFTKNYELDLQNATGNEDISGGIIELVRIYSSLKEDAATNTLLHELFVHVDKDIDRLQAVDGALAGGSMKKGSIEYRQKLISIGASAKEDHDNLSKGKVQKYKAASQALDAKKGTTKYTKLYEDDVKTIK